MLSAGEASAVSSAFYPYDSGIVYMLPSGVSTPYWMSAYGDRTEFYVHSNISLQKAGIMNDFDIISKKYRFIVRILPVDDSDFSHYNLQLMDSWAAQKNLKILYGFFPKSKYGPEPSYLNSSSTIHERLIGDMQYVAKLSSTAAVAVWYGWSRAPFDVQAIHNFYTSLPKDLQSVYCIWLDSGFVIDAVKAGLPKLVDPLNITVVTELYSADLLSQYGFAFKHQIIVSGVSGTNSILQWETQLDQILASVHATGNSADYSLRKLVVWIFWDRNDGSNEQFTAYLNGELRNPILTSTPSSILLDQSSPTSARVNEGATVSLRYHFSWPDKYNTANLLVDVNGTQYPTDANGWVTLNVSSSRVERIKMSPSDARWGPYGLTVKLNVPVPQVIFDKVLIKLSATSNPIQIGTNATILSQGTYEYDGTPFQGTITLNQTIKNAKPGTYHLVVKQIDDSLYGLTVFDSNGLTVTVTPSPIRPVGTADLIITILILASLAVAATWIVKRRMKEKTQDSQPQATC